MGNYIRNENKDVNTESKQHDFFSFLWYAIPTLSVNPGSNGGVWKEPLAGMLHTQLLAVSWQISPVKKLQRLTLDASGSPVIVQMRPPDLAGVCPR